MNLRVELTAFTQRRATKLPLNRGKALCTRTAPTTQLPVLVMSWYIMVWKQYPSTPSRETWNFGSDYELLREKLKCVPCSWNKELHFSLKISRLLKWFRMPTWLDGQIRPSEVPAPNQYQLHRMYDDEGKGACVQREPACRVMFARFRANLYSDCSFHLEKTNVRHGMAYCEVCESDFPSIVSFSSHCVFICTFTQAYQNGIGSRVAWSGGRGQGTQVEH